MGGAVVAIAAIHARRIREVLDAYRTGPATSAEEALDPVSLGLEEHERQVEELQNAGVLRSGARPGSYFLDERRYIAYRDGGKRKKKLVILIIVLLALSILYVGTAVSASP